MDDEQIDNYVREMYRQCNPNPDRTGCPDPAVIRLFVLGRLPASHPFYAHVGACSPCWTAMEEERYRLQMRRAGVWLAATLAVIVLLVLLLAR